MMTTANLTAQVTTKGVSKADSDLKKLSRTAKTTESNVGKMEEGFKSVGKNASAAISAIDGPLGGISSRVSSLVTLFTSGTAAATAFGIAISAAGASVISGTLELDEYNVALRRTEQLLISTGQASGFTAQELRDQADALALATLTSTQEVQKAQAVLLTFNRVSTDVFTDAIRLSQDLAESGFGSITSNATQLGKALQDPITGISALTRVGVTFSDSQKELIRTLTETNDVLGAQQIIIQALESQVGGAGAAVAVDTLAGSWDTFTDVLGKFNVQGAETLGITDSIRSVLDQTSKDIQAITDALDKNSRSNFDALIRQRQELKQQIEDLGDIGSLPLFGNLFGPSQADAALLQDELKAVESEIQRIQEVEKQRQLEITEAREAGARKQKEIAEQSALDFAAAEEKKAAKEREVLQRQFETRQAAAQQELQRLEAANDSELEAIARREFDKLELIRGFREQGLITDQEFTDAETEILRTATEARTELRQKEADDALAIAEKQAAEQDKIEQRRNDLAIDALRDTTASLKSTLGEQNSIYKASAITKATIDTYNAANGAYAALASIPVVGPALGAAAAGVAIGAGLANVQQIASARRQGGSLAAGQSSTISEEGRTEIITPASNSRVRTAEQMRSIMGENSSQPQVSLVVIDQSTGSKDFTQETDDDGRIILLIQDTVATDLARPNSRISKSLNANTNAGRSR